MQQQLPSPDATWVKIIAIYSLWVLGHFISRGWVILVEKNNNFETKITQPREIKAQYSQWIHRFISWGVKYLPWETVSPRIMNSHLLVLKSLRMQCLRLWRIQQEAFDVSKFKLGRIQHSIKACSLKSVK